MLLQEYTPDGPSLLSLSSMTIEFGRCNAGRWAAAVATLQSAYPVRAGLALVCSGDSRAPAARMQIASSIRQQD